jgi:hypothetical protein
MATDIIESPNLVVPVGSLATFKHKANPTVARYLKDGIIARIFALSATEDDPRPIEGLSDIDCDVYLSVVHRLVPSDNQTLKLETVKSLDYSWLSINYGRDKVSPGRYRIVFERPLGGGFNADYFRLLKKHASEYFDSGFILTISPENTSLDWDSVLTNYDERFKRRVNTVSQYPSKKSLVPCYSVVKETLKVQSLIHVAKYDLLECSTSGSTEIGSEPG